MPLWIRICALRNMLVASSSSTSREKDAKKNFFPTTKISLFRPRMSGYEKVHSSESSESLNAQHNTSVCSCNSRTRTRNLIPWLCCVFSLVVTFLTIAFAIVQNAKLGQTTENLATDFSKFHASFCSTSSANFKQFRYLRYDSFKNTSIITMTSTRMVEFYSSTKLVRMVCTPAILRRRSMMLGASY